MLHVCNRQSTSLTHPTHPPTHEVDQRGAGTPRVVQVGQSVAQSWAQVQQGSRVRAGLPAMRPYPSAEAEGCRMGGRRQGGTALCMHRQPAPSASPAAPLHTVSCRPSTGRRPPTASMAATNCISDVPGFAKQTSMPAATAAHSRRSAPVGGGAVAAAVAAAGAVPRDDMRDDQARGSVWDAGQSLRVPGRRAERSASGVPAGEGAQDGWLDARSEQATKEAAEEANRKRAAKAADWTCSKPKHGLRPRMPSSGPLHTHAALQPRSERPQAATALLRPGLLEPSTPPPLPAPPPSLRARRCRRWPLAPGRSGAAPLTGGDAACHRWQSPCSDSHSLQEQQQQPWASMTLGTGRKEVRADAAGLVAAQRGWVPQLRGSPWLVCCRRRARPCPLSLLSAAWTAEVGTHARASRPLPVSTLRGRRRAAPLDPAAAHAPPRFPPPQEDDLLRQLIGEYGPKNWSIIANGIRGRSGKSCRLRCGGGVAAPCGRSRERVQP